jgi:hypothetical protein
MTALSYIVENAIPIRLKTTNNGLYIFRKMIYYIDRMKDIIFI